MNIRTKGFLGVAVLVLTAALTATVTAPGQLLAQDPAPASMPLLSGRHSAPSLHSAPVCRAPVGGSSASPLSADALRPFGRVFRVNGADTWGDSVWPLSESDGYLLVADHQFGNSFVPSLLEFGPVGDLVRSTDLSIVPGWAKSAIMTGDGGYLIGTAMDVNTAMQGQPSSGIGGQPPEPSSGRPEPAVPSRLEAIGQQGRLLKLSSTLTVQWAKAFSAGEPSASQVAGLAQTADGGYVLAVRDNNRLGIVKLNAGGGVQWKKGILPTAEGRTVTVYSVVENTYFDADGHRQCGGYILYGGVLRTGTDWDIYLAALSCDGKNLLWQRIVSGPGWEASYYQGPYFFDNSTNLLIVEERNGLNSQDASLLLAATTDSYGTGEAILLVPFRVTGDTTLSNPPDLGPFKILDGLDDEQVIGPYGGPNLIRLSDGNVLLGGSIVSASNGQENALLVKLTPGLDIIWQVTYDRVEQVVSMHQLPDSILVSGGGPSGVLLRLAPDGTGEGPCLSPIGSNLTIGDVAPDVVVPAYSLDDGTLQIANTTVSKTEVPANPTCPQFLYVPIVMHIQR